jgi:hypothetical protein
MRFAVKKLNAGDAGLFLKLAQPSAVIRFPGDNSWSTMFRPAVKAREPHATHIGVDECRAFADRFVDEGVQFDIEDILINGPPWNTRIALRVVSYVPHPSGGPDIYNNRALALLETSWGRLRVWEDYEDCERIAAWDRTRNAPGANCR